MRRRRRFPEEFVCSPRGAVAEQQPVAAQLNAQLAGESFHPGAVDRAGLGQRVLVAEAGEVVVARIGVAALAVG